MSDSLTCDKCGDEMEVEISDDEGRPMSAAEYRELLDITGWVLYCEKCAPAESSRNADGLSG